MSSAKNVQSKHEQAECSVGSVGPIGPREPSPTGPVGPVGPIGPIDPMEPRTLDPGKPSRAGPIDPGKPSPTEISTKIIYPVGTLYYFDSENQKYMVSVPLTYSHLGQASDATHTPPFPIEEKPGLPAEETTKEVVERASGILNQLWKKVEDEPTPIWKRWWFWLVVVGTVAAGTAVVVVVRRRSH